MGSDRNSPGETNWLGQDHPKKNQKQSSLQNQNQNSKENSAHSKLRDSSKLCTLTMPKKRCDIELGLATAGKSESLHRLRIPKSNYQTEMVLPEMDPFFGYKRKKTYGF